ncbi:outer membrane protein assembly factor BamB [soil metagenome]
MRFALKLAAAGAVLLLAGCSTLASLNPFAAKAAPRNPPAALVEIKTTLGVRTAWSTSIGSAGAYTFSPAVAEHNLFVAAADGAISRIDIPSGRSLWRINAGVRLTAGVGSDGNTVAVAGEKGSVLAFDGSGKLRWTAQTSSEVLSAPAVGQGLVIVRSLDNRIVAFDAETGARRWTVQRNTPSLTLRTAPGITIADSSVYVALPGGRLLALALSNGGQRWEVAVGDPRGATELERIADISGAPMSWARDICAVAYQGRVGCFDTVSGNLRWAKTFSSDAGIGIDERFVFAPDEHGVLTAFTRESGASVWRNTQLSNRRLSAPVSYGRAVAVGDGQGFVHFLSREDGAMLARLSIDASPVITAPLIDGAFLIFQTQAGTVVAIAVE